MAAMDAGGLWNTFGMAAKVEMFWQLGWLCLPEVMQLFEAFGNTIGTALEAQTLRMIYEEMPHKNFSSDVLQKVPEQVGVLEMRDVMWSDWGQPVRIQETLCAIGTEPAFSVSGERSPSLSGREKQLMNIGI